MFCSVSYLKRNIFIFLPFVYFLWSCTENALVETQEMQEPEPVGYPNVDERLWPFYEKFEIEGKLRGIPIDLRAENISGEIVEIHKENVAGQCNFNHQNPNHVSIDLEFWNNSNERFKEFVVFHELGHCHLLRAHREEQNLNGTCKSIMRSGNGNCFDNYNRSTRTGYIDELFDTRFVDSIFDIPNS